MELIDRFSKEELAERQQVSRRNILETLQLLSSVEDQLEYQRNVPHVNIIGELICGWFNDNYWPKDKIFLSAFSTEELQAMSAFNEAFDNTLRIVPLEPLPEITNLVQTLEWEGLIQAAQKALQCFREQTAAKDSITAAETGAAPHVL